MSLKRSMCLWQPLSWNYTKWQRVVNAGIIQKYEIWNKNSESQAFTLPNQYHTVVTLQESNWSNIHLSIVQDKQKINIKKMITWSMTTMKLIQKILLTGTLQVTEKRFSNSRYQRGYIKTRHVYKTCCHGYMWQLLKLFTTVVIHVGNNNP